MRFSALGTLGTRSSLGTLRTGETFARPRGGTLAAYNRPAGEAGGDGLSRRARLCRMAATDRDRCPPPHRVGVFRLVNPPHRERWQGEARRPEPWAWRSQGESD